MSEPDGSPQELTDGALQSEIELVGDLVVAATSATGPLAQAQIDRILGVDREPTHPAEGAASGSDASCVGAPIASPPAQN